MTDVLLIDSIGRRCPQPVIDLAHAILAIPIGAVVDVLADDPVAAVDIPAWCWTQGHDYLGEQPPATAPGADPHAADAADAAADGQDRVHRYRVRRVV